MSASQPGPSSSFTRLALPTIGLLVFAFFGSACGEEFEPYNKVQGFRVLAIRADKPWFQENETTTLDALIFQEDPSEPVEYEWSWCPFPGSSSDGYQCAITQEELQQIIDQALAQAAEEQGTPPLSFPAPSLDLGNEPTATFAYPLPAVFIQGLCEALQGQDLPDFVSLPDCSKGLEVTIRMVARSGGQEIISVKDVTLVYDKDGEINQNPRIDGVVAKPICLRNGEKELCPPDFAGFPLSTDPDAPAFYRDELYRLQLSIPEEASETFTPSPTENDPNPAPQRETLAISWFTQNAELQFGRTGFIEGETTFEDASINDWETPRKRDFAGETTKLWFVIRDGRGGINWIEREVRLLD